MRRIPAQVDGDFVLIQYDRESHSVFLTGGDRPALAARGYQEGRLYAYSKDRSDDPTFEQYEPGRWRRYECSVWNKRVTDIAELSSSTIYKMPCYRGVPVISLEWPRHCQAGSQIHVVVGPGMLREYMNRTTGVDSASNPLANLELGRDDRFSAWMQAEGWKLIDEYGWGKVVAVADLDLKSEPGIPRWLREVLSPL